jgi:hypothetical protein
MNFNLFGGNMKLSINVIFIILSMILIIGCESDDDIAIVEGTVGYFPPTAAVGGESDPFGFILQNYKFITGSPTYSYSRVYLNGLVDSSYINLQIRVKGKVERLSAGGVETPRRYFPKVDVSEIQAIE